MSKTMKLKQFGYCAIGAMLLCGAQAVAQPRPGGPDQQAGPPQGAPPASPDGAGPQGFVATPKLLAPLPPPPPGSAPPSADPRDFEGVWLAEMSMQTLSLNSLANLDARNPFPGPLGVDPAKLTKTALEKRQYAEDMNRKGTPLASDAARCRPMNDIGIGGDAFPVEVIQTSKEVVLLQEEGRTRWVIHMNRGHLRNLQPSFWGDSVGHWEGNTLVVDTTGFNGAAQDTTKTTHVVSKLRKMDGGDKLELTVTVDDPQTYLEPITRISTSGWHPELQVLEFQCEENPEGALEGLTTK